MTVRHQLLRSLQTENIFQLIGVCVQLISMGDEFGLEYRVLRLPPRYPSGSSEE